MNQEINELKMSQEKKSIVLYGNDTRIAELVSLLAAEAKVGKRISHPEESMPFLAPYIHQEQEHFIVILLNGAHEVIKTVVVSVGLANRTLVHPREVFKEAIRENACALIISHNHPSGALIPSDDDKGVTSRMKLAGELLGIPVLDHLIISPTGYRSMVAWDEF